MMEMEDGVRWPVMVDERRWWRWKTGWGGWLWWTGVDDGGGRWVGVVGYGGRV